MLPFRGIGYVFGLFFPGDFPSLFGRPYYGSLLSLENKSSEQKYWELSGVSSFLANTGGFFSLLPFGQYSVLTLRRYSLCVGPALV